MKVVKIVENTPHDKYEVLQFDEDLYGLRRMPNGAWRKRPYVLKITFRSVDLAETCARGLHQSWSEVAKQIRWMDSK